MTTTNDASTPVLIAGGGPSGSILALSLAKFGIRSIVLERRNHAATIPKAHAVNPRTQEICHALGVDIDALRALSAPESESGYVQFLPRVTGPLFGTLRYERLDDGAREFTPYPLINVPQPEFESILHDAVDRQPLIDFRRGHEWTSAAQVGGRVTSSIRSAEGPYEVTSEYLIGADGASSPIRAWLDIPLTGVPEVNSAVSIIFKADLRSIVAGRPGVLYWLTDPEISSTLLCYHVDRLWALVISQPAGEPDTSEYTPEYSEEFVRKAVGYEHIDFDLEILRTISWTVTSEIADTYRVENTLLVGDAAHRFPPTGGLGLNTGTQDAHNLAWKLAAVLNGWGTDELLDSYERERRPIAIQNADQSLANSRRLSVLSELACPADIATSPVALEAWMEDDDRRARIDSAIADQEEHFDSFALQLGFTYNTEATPPVDIRVFIPTANPGDRMPHAWIEVDGTTQSSLDLLDGHAFTLIAGPGGAGWAATAGEWDAPLRVTRLAPQPDVVHGWLRLLGIEDDGAILVRPDGHIAARLSSTTTRDDLRLALAAASRGEIEATPANLSNR